MNCIMIKSVVTNQYAATELVLSVRKREAEDERK